MSLGVLQATAWYAPEHVGGTEVYVEGLAAGLAERGIASTIVTPREGKAESYEYAGRKVETYPVGAARADEMRTGTPHDGFERFRRLIEMHRSAIYHQHSWTRGYGPLHLAAARHVGMKTVLTVHVAAATCCRGTMLRFGTTPCDGIVEARRCGACWAHGRGMPRLLSSAAARLPLSLAEQLRRMPSRLATGLSARAIAAQRQHQVRAMIANADRIVAVCRWLADALLANGVPAERLLVSRQGLPDGAPHEPTSAPSEPDRPLSILYLGRWDPVKGVDVLVRAVLDARSDVRLTMRGLAQDDDSRAYAARVRTLASDDPRISFAPSLPRAEVAAELARHDVLAVPSQCMETGPMVVLEAQAAGLFVLGSRLGGIAETIADSGGGELVAAADTAEWTRAIDGLAARHMRRGRPLRVRTMSEVAAEMAALYESL